MKFTFLVLFTLFVFNVNAQNIGDYQSASTGDWTTSPATRWDVWDGDSWEDAISFPNSSSGVIHILNGHNITIGLLSVTADQIVVDAGGILTVNNSLLLDDGSGTDLEVNGELSLNNTLGIASGTPNVQADGIFGWLGGTLSVPLVNSSGASLNILGSNKILTSTLTNNGTVNWSASQITFNNGTLINNNSFIATAASSFNHSGSNNLFTNAAGATFSKVSNAGNITFNIPVINAGSILLEAGTISITGVNASLVNSGPVTYNGGFGFTVAGSAALNVFNPGTSFTGTGTLVVSEDLDVNTSLVIPSTVTTAFNAASNIIGGTGSLEFNGLWDWNSGTISIPVTISATGTVSLSVSSVKILSNVLTNNGVINWGGFNLGFNNGTLVNNNEISVTGSSAFTHAGGVNSFVNSATGMFTKITSPGNTIFNIPVSNAGLIDIATGSVTSTTANATLQNSGRIILRSGSILNVSGTMAGGNSFNAGTLITGEGTINISTNTSVNAAVSVPSLVTLSYNGLASTLGGSGSLAINGTMNWGAGTLAVPSTINAGANLNLNTANKALTTIITNNGTTDWSAFAINFSNGTFNNNGNFLISGTATNFTITSLTTNAFNNAGTITKTSAGTTGTGSVPVNNSGIINVNAGTLAKSGSNVIPFNNTGTINIASGAVFSHTIGLTTGALILDPGTVIAGNGSFNALANTVINVPLNVPSTITMQIGSDAISPAITGTGSITINGTASWAQGVLSVPMTIATGATLNSTAQKTVSSTLVNNGSIVLTDPTTGSISLNNGSITNNGTITDNFTGARFFPNGGGINSFINNGVYHKSNTSTITFALGVPVTNNGGAVIGGNGTFTFTGGITNAGILAPGGTSGIGLVTMTANAVNPANTPAIQIHVLNGSGAGTGHDQLAMSGITTLTGSSLVVTETSGAPSQAYIVMTAPGPNGFVGNFSSTALPAGYSLVIDNTTNPSTVTVTKTGGQTSPPEFSFVPANVTVQCNDIPAVGTPAASGSCAGTITINYNGQTITPGSCTDSYTITRTWTASDNCGNSTQASQIITVIDDTDPVFGFVPANTSVECNSIPGVGTPTASDNCDASVTISYEGEVITPGANVNSYTITRTWTATDNCGNSTNATQVITVTDGTAPVFSFVPANTGAECSSIPAVGTPTATDNCDNNVEIIYEGEVITPGTCPGSYTITRTWTAKDNAGNSVQAVQTITVSDNTVPLITCPGNAVRSATSNCTYTASSNEFNATASDNCSGVSLSYVLTGVTTGTGASLNGIAFNKGVTTVTWTATDGCGHSSVCSFTVTVNDVTSPSIVCPGDIANNSNCTAQSVTVPNPVTNDNCGVTTLTWAMTGVTTGSSATTGINYIGTRTFNPGVTTVTYTVKDAAGNSNTCSFTVTLTGSSLPSITCPADITINALSQLCYATVSSLGNPVVSGGCGGGTVSVSNNHPSNQYPVGVTEVIWSATANGNTVNCIQKVTVRDLQLPTMVCPSNLILTADAGECFASNYNLGTPTSTFDNCGIASISNNAPAQLPLGITIVTWTIEDVNGNINTCNQQVEVRDGTAPSITCPADITQPAIINCTRSITVPNPVVSDECSSVSRLTWVMTGATTGNSATTGINYIGTRTFNAGITTITYTARDGAGNTSTCSFTVTVTGAGAASIVCPANITENSQGKNCNKSVKVPNPVILSGCGSMASLTWVMTGATNASSPLSGINYVGTRTFNVGTTTITYTVKDAAGNTNSCSFNVKVIEHQKPQLDCSKGIVIWAGNSCSKSVTIPNVTATDNCGVSSLTWQMTGATTASSPATGIHQIGTRTFNAGITFVTYTATDASGNERSCSFTVIVMGYCNFQVRNSQHRSLPREEVKEVVLTSKLQAGAYPNPSASGFNLVVKASNMKETVQVRVYDVVGRLVYQAKGLPGSFRLGDQLVAGTYLVEVMQGRERTQVKLLKK